MPWDATARGERHHQELIGCRSGEAAKSTGPAPAHIRPNMGGGVSHPLTCCTIPGAIGEVVAPVGPIGKRRTQDESRPSRNAVSRCACSSSTPGRSRGGGRESNPLGHFRTLTGSEDRVTGVSLPLNVSHHYAVVLAGQGKTPECAPYHLSCCRPAFLNLRRTLDGHLGEAVVSTVLRAPMDRVGSSLVRWSTLA